MRRAPRSAKPLIATLLVAAGTLVPFAAGASVSAPVRRVAFVHGGDIWTVRTDGRGPRNLTQTTGAVELSPSWSPDGMAIAYLRGSEIWEMDADGANQHRIAGGVPSGFGWYVRNAGVDWSSTGRLVYTTWDEQAHNPAIVVSNGDGSDAREIPLDPNLPGEHRTPWYEDLAWTPDGAGLVFGIDDIDERWGIFTLNADGSGLRHVEGTTAGDRGPRLSPDGTRLVYTRDRSLGKGAYDVDLRLSAAGGRGARWLTSLLGADLGGSWSPDGVQVVFASQRGPKKVRDSNPYDCYIVDVHTGRVHRLLHLPGNEFDPQWQPG